MSRLSHQEGRLQEAESLLQQALVIRERALGGGHPDLVQNLEDYAALLRETGRSNDALRLEARARAIRTSQEARRPAW